MSFVITRELRARFAVTLAELYGREVPAYNTLVEVSQQVNQDVLSADPVRAERLGSIERVTAERHGAIRVGSEREIRDAARVFAGFGMYPTGFYDLRDARPQPIPVVSTAFRPQDPDELAGNPFRVFTSVLVPQDRRFFDADLQSRIQRFVEGRTLFPPALLTLADRAAALGGLDPGDATELLTLATGAFALSTEPIDRSWYTELERISAVAADIAGVSSTHINHLTPRVLDIDRLYQRMSEKGITMIDEIQGPPAWPGPDVLLRQTSFRALAEPRRFREPDGRITQDTLRVRFGEVEARGIALTPRGRDRFDEAMAETDRRCATLPASARQRIAVEVWTGRLPATEAGLEGQDLAYFTYHPRQRPERAGTTPRSLDGLLDARWVVPEPVVYEDFLPRSAAGIFASNLTDQGSMDADRAGERRDIGWLSAIIEADIAIPDDLYAAQRSRSLRGIANRFGLPHLDRENAPARADTATRPRG